MKSNKLTKALAPFLLAATATTSAQMVDNNPHNPGSINSLGGSATVLMDQTGLAPRGNGAPDQNFESAYDIYDSMVADDFVVTGDGWSIESVSIVGTSAGAETTVNISFMDNAGGLPGSTALCTYSDVAITTNVGGAHEVMLPTPCELRSGTYWMVYQTNLDFAVGGQHFASNTDVVNGSPAVWANPGDGFGTGCTAFSNAAGCGVGGGAPDYDFLYGLQGSILPPQPVPTLSWFGMALMLLTLGFFGHRFIKNEE